MSRRLFRLHSEGLVALSENPCKKEIEVLFDSIAPQKMPYEQAVAILGDQSKWEKLDKGQKLNVMKAYARGVAKELDVEPVPIRLARFKGRHARRWHAGNALSIEHGIAFNVSRMKYAVNVSSNIDHEMRHILHFHVVDSDHKPRTLPAQEVIEEWQASIIKRPEDGIMDYPKKEGYYENPLEVDARAFEVSHGKATFGENRDVWVPEKLRDRALEQIGLRKVLLCMKIAGLSPEEKTAELNEEKQKNPYLKHAIEKYQGLR